MLQPWDGVSCKRRISGLRLLHRMHGNWVTSRRIEAAIAATVTSDSAYADRVSQLAWNLNQNPHLRRVETDQLVGMRDFDMAKDTVIELIVNEAAQRRRRFDAMLQEKYELLNDKSYASTLTCRKCGSAEVNWEQKQTRGADEAMTIFCTCSTCHNRWKMS